MESNLQYAEKEYWDKRFEKEESFEWLANFEAFKHIILDKLKPADRLFLFSMLAKCILRFLYPT